ncbi:MAG: polyketide synthase dehydratase domain-containing protein [Desulfobacterales bacterium]|nr:polyketide synthase dehydratase domain-containing protein [Desulfobacterales bacterium]
MEGIPPIVDSIRLPVEIPVAPHYFDHHIEGKAVLPAVEAMQILAKAVNNFRPELSAATMNQARFEKFLHIPAGSPKIDAFAELEMYTGGDVRALLLTKTKSGKSGITRSMVHAAVLFPRKRDGHTLPPIDMPAFLEGTCVEVSPEKIYRDLVPFGPCYRNIIAPLYISENGAIAQIKAPDDPDGPRDGRSLGSPFPLDAAFHAACVWAQCYKDTVAFPVGFGRRNVYHPTLPGCAYFGRVAPAKADSNPLIFNIWIYDTEGELCESVSGVLMRDVSAGRVTPPPWIKKAGKGCLFQNIRPNCRELSVAEIKTLPPFADKALSGSEIKRFQPMGMKRRQSFLAARLACKRISRRLSGNDFQTPAGDIDTLCPDLSRPCCRQIGTAAAVDCSVSHDDRFVIAVVSDERVGIDVEKISARVLRSQDLFMDEPERQLVQASRLGAVEAAIRIWSIKEAVAKALDLNLAEAWQRVAVKRVGRYKSRFQIDSAETFSAFHDTVEKHIFTLACLP